MSGPPRWAHRAEHALFRLAAGPARALPPKASAIVAAGLGAFAHDVLRIRRGVVASNLRHAFPEKPARWIRKTARAAYAHLIREGMATLRAAARGLDALAADTPVEGLDVVRAGLDCGHGVIVLGGHLGNWEIGAGLLAAHGLPVHAMARRQRNPLFDRELNEVRRRLGLTVFDRSEARRQTLAALRANRVVVIIADQDARRAGIFVPFFGRLASTARGPAVLAVRARAAVAMMVPLRQPDGRLHVRYERVDFDPAAPPDVAARRLTALFMQRLEAHVREAPAQYLWHHRRWKTKPPEDGVEEPADGEPV